VRAVLGVLAAFLLGALPWGLWLGKMVAGVDVRTMGSGNPGATNVYRTLGARLGITVFALDVAKGVAAVYACRAIAGDAFPGGAPVAALAGALASVLGHVASPFAGWKGGKGVATGAGAMLAVAPVAALLGLATFAVLLAVSRRVSVGSITAALVFATALWLLPFARADRATALVGTAVAVLLIVRHAPNIRRLMRGEEPPFRFKGGAEKGA
jgi:glycerol-3-phosphate acyltransferase PlsY